MVRIIIKDISSQNVKKKMFCTFITKKNKKIQTPPVYFLTINTSATGIYLIKQIGVTEPVSSFSMEFN